MHITRFLHSHTGRTMMSIILGLGIASLFRQTCKGTNCILMRAPPIATISNNIFKYPSSDKCIKYDIIPLKCDKTKKIYQYE